MVDEQSRRRAGPARPKPKTPVADPIVPVLAHVVLVDARSERLAVMRALLEGGELVAVVGEAESLDQAIDEVTRTGADLAIVEIQMPVNEGLATVTGLRERFPMLRIIVCSFHHLTTTMQQASDNGADAYLVKPVDVMALGRLLRLYAETTRQPAIG